MSQRKEDISEIDSYGNIKYTYTAPTGFISGDDIVGENFRTMFATMNYKRLIATKTNPVTGYKMYNFDFIKPINFDGTFKSVIGSDKSKNLYNGDVSIPKENTTIWEKIGIDFNADSRPDYDHGESANTQTRTIEDTSIDYYLYRFGLTYEELRKTNQKHQRRFLNTDGNKMYLPQYENSYYFYFGLKNGATALDEFNKQFFSECENGMLMIGEPTVNIAIEGDIEDQICEGKVDVNVLISNLDIPYQSIEITSDVDFMEEYGPNKSLLIVNNDNEEEFDEWLTSYMFMLSGCNFGTYNITIRDANDIIYTKTEKIGMDILSFESVVRDFNFNTDVYTKNDDLLFRGGYIEVSKVKIDALSSEIPLFVYIEGINGEFRFQNNGEGTAQKLGVEKPGEYELRVRYECGGNEVHLLMQTFIVRDNSHLGLYMGDPNIESIPLTVDKYNPNSEWWVNMDKWIEKVSTFNETPTANRGKETSFIRVYAVGGDKAVWGYPQNTDGLYKTVYTSEDVTSWPNGYTLDDEYVYYPTFGPKGNVQFSALAHDGVMVMGNYEKTTTNGNGGSSSYLKNGYGYIFKPVPDGDLEFHIYNGSYTANTSTNGVFYPSVAYPSVDRPFYAKTRFYCWQRRKVEMTANNEGGESPQVIDYSEGGRTEMVIHNGVTYGNSFWKDSFVDNIQTIPTIDSNDINGAVSNSDRLTEFKKLLGHGNLYLAEKVINDEGYINGGESGITSYGYEIIGGAENERNVQLSNSISDSIDALFGAYVKFIATGNGATIFPIAVGDSYGVAEYGIKEINTNFINLSEDKYIYLRTGKKTIYACCTYAAPNSGEIDQTNTEGGPVIVKITTDDNADNAVEKIKVLYPYTNLEGAVVEFNKTFKPKKSGLNKNERKGIVNILEYVFDNCPGIKGVKDYRIKYDDTTENEFEWEGKISGATNAVTWSNNKDYFAYGVIKSTNSDTILYKIYPNPVRVVEPGEEDLDKLKLKIDPTSVTLPYVAQSRAEVSVISYRKDPWTATVDGDWISIDVNEKRDKITITVAENKEYSSRTGYITIGYDDDESVKIEVIQTEFGIVFPEYPEEEPEGDNNEHAINHFWTTLDFNNGGTISVVHSIGEFYLSPGTPRTANIYLPPLYLHCDPYNGDSDVLDKTYVTIEMEGRSETGNIISSDTVLSDTSLSNISGNISMPRIYLEDASEIRAYSLTVNFRYDGVYEGDDRAMYIEMQFIDGYATYEFLS